jgi:hypothetical protein
MYTHGPPVWGLGDWLITPHCTKPACYKMLHRVSEFAGSCEYSNEPLGSVKGRVFLD